MALHDRLRLGTGCVRRSDAIAVNGVNLRGTVNQPAWACSVREARGRPLLPLAPCGEHSYRTATASPRLGKVSRVTHYA